MFIPQDDWLSPDEFEDLGAFKFLICFALMSRKMPWTFRLKSAFMWAGLWIVVLCNLPQIPASPSIPLTLTVFLLFMYQGLRIFTMIAFCMQRMFAGEYTAAAF